MLSASLNFSLSPRFRPAAGAAVQGCEGGDAGRGQAQADLSAGGLLWAGVGLLPRPGVQRDGCRVPETGRAHRLRAARRQDPLRGQDSQESRRRSVPYFSSKCIY